jgi:hypothetical protein
MSDKEIDKEKTLEQFYTNPEVASNICLANVRNILCSFVDLNEVLFIEPSAGDGSFYNLLPENKLGFDIDPKIEDIIQADFLEVSASQLGQDEKMVIVGNPPFGKKGILALQFLNEGLRMSPFVCFILPVIFKKWSVQSKVNPMAKLLFKTDLPKNSFIFKKKPCNIHCCFQIWTTKAIEQDLRLKEKPPISHPDFEIWQYNNTKQALSVFKNKFDFAVPRQGYQDYTRRETNRRKCEKTTQWILFRAKNEEVRDRLMSIDYVELSNNNTTTPGFGKADIVRRYKEISNA